MSFDRRALEHLYIDVVVVVDCAVSSRVFRTYSRHPVTIMFRLFTTCAGLTWQMLSIKTAAAILSLLGLPFLCRSYELAVIEA